MVTFLKGLVVFFAVMTEYPRNNSCNTPDKEAFKADIRGVMGDHILTTREAQKIANKYAKCLRKTTSACRQGWRELALDIRLDFQRAVGTRDDGDMWPDTINALIRKASLPIESSESWDDSPTSSKAAPAKMPPPQGQGEIEKVENGYTLSQRDFQWYFWGKKVSFIQWNIGDCWIIASLISLMRLEKYEDLVRTSVSVEWTPMGYTFTIKLPLWDPQGTAYHVTDNDIRSQLTIEGDTLNLMMTGATWLLAIIHAFGQKMTGRRQLDFQVLSGGRSEEAIYGLIGGMEIYKEWYITKGKENVQFQWNFKRVLQDFDPKRHVLNLYVFKSGTWYQGIDNEGTINHAISVVWVERGDNGEIKTVSISDPLAYSVVAIPYEDISRYTGEYTLGSPEKVPYLQKIDDVKAVRSVKWQYGNDGVREDTINGIIRETAHIDIDQRLSRGDVIVREESLGVISVESWWKMDTTVLLPKEWINPNLIVRVGDIELNLAEHHFSRTFRDKTHEKYTQYLYPLRLAVFISKMRHDYIDTRRGKSGDPQPFSLGRKGEILFHTDPDKSETTIELIKRHGAEMVNGNHTTVLSDWGLLGLLSRDTDTKTRIVAFLNRLYAQWS